MVIKEAPKPVIDKDMEQPEIDESKYAWNNTDLSEYWPDIENPFLKKTEEKKVESLNVETQTTDTEVVEEQEIDDTPKVERIEEDQYEKYRALKENKYCAVLLAGRVKAKNARYIQIEKDERGVSIAKAEVIITLVDVTDAGRIKRGLEDGIKTNTPVVLTYYLDKGWLLINE